MAKHVSTRVRMQAETQMPGATPLQYIAALLLRLEYRDFMTMARDIHSDSDTIGKTSNDVANILAGWAMRELEKAAKVE
jgi:hypothetical protein